MRPLIEFTLACILVLVAGCSAIAGMFSAGLWTAFFAAGSVIGLILLFTCGAKNKQ